MRSFSVASFLRRRTGSLGNVVFEWKPIGHAWKISQTHTKSDNNTPNIVSFKIELGHYFESLKDIRKKKLKDS